MDRGLGRSPHCVLTLLLAGQCYPGRIPFFITPQPSYPSMPSVSLPILFTPLLTHFFQFKRTLYSLLFQSISFIFSIQGRLQVHKISISHFHPSLVSKYTCLAESQANVMCIHGLEAVFLVPETTATAHMKRCTVLLAWVLHMSLYTRPWSLIQGK